jgi:hypothetical protein
MYSIPNISDLLARAIYADLCLLLAPPPDDAPAARHLCDERAMTAVAHLLPENAAEAEVAVLVVAAQSRAREACVPRPSRASSPTKPDAVPPRPPP